MSIVTGSVSLHLHCGNDPGTPAGKMPRCHALVSVLDFGGCNSSIGREVQFCRIAGAYRLGSRREKNYHSTWARNHLPAVFAACGSLDGCDTYTVHSRSIQFVECPHPENITMVPIFGGLLHWYGDHPYYHATFEHAKQNLLHHLRCCIPILAGATGVCSVLRASAAGNKKRKRGQKSATEKAAYNEMVKRMFIGFFQDEGCQSLRAYLIAHGIEFVYGAMYRRICANERLKFIKLGVRRKDKSLVKEALDIICGDDRNKENESDNRDSVDSCENILGDIDVAQERTIFDFQ